MKRFLLLLMTSLSLMFVSCFSKENDFGGKQEEPDMDALKKWIQDKRLVTVKEIGGDLTVSGEVRCEAQVTHEEKDSMQIRGLHGHGHRPTVAYDIEFNLMMDYRSERSWAAVKIEFDNDMGTISGTVNKLNLERAYLGGRVVPGETFIMDVELGRRNLNSIYDSKIEFSSIFDGLLVKLNKSFERIGNFYVNSGVFLVNDKKNHYGYVSELGMLRVGNTGLYFESKIGVYSILFLMATQSAVFGPSKYGIIPEIVPTSDVPKANGALVAFTFLAIIVGTFLASLVTDITNRHFFVAGNLCTVIAVFGLLASLKIKKTPACGSQKKINPLFVYEIYQTLKLSYKRKYLLPSIFGSAFFLFLGGYVQLNVIPFAIQSLNLTEVEGGYLFLSTAIGIAIGSLLAGKISQNRIELGLSCLSGFILSFLLIMLGIYHSSLIYTILILVLLGVFGGFFVIPFDSFIQVKSPENRRGQIIATSNFMSFTCVLIASVLLYILSNLLKLSAATGFIVIGFLTFIFNFVNTGRLSDFFFPYVAKLILKPFYRMEISELPPKNSIIIMNDFSWRQMLTLFSKIDNLKIITAGKKFKNFPLLNSFSDTIFMISEKKLSISTIKEAATKVNDKDSIICLLFRTPFDQNELKKEFSDKHTLFIMKTEKRKILKTFLGKTFSRTMFTAIFERI